eukprot:1140377-Pelagomonas_calceolata.AAC.8
MTQVCNAGMATRSAMPESENIWQSESPLEGRSLPPLLILHFARSPDAWSSVLALNLETPVSFGPRMRFCGL